MGIILFKLSPVSGSITSAYGAIFKDKLVPSSSVDVNAQKNEQILNTKTNECTTTISHIQKIVMISPFCPWRPSA